MNSYNLIFSLKGKMHSIKMSFSIKVVKRDVLVWQKKGIQAGQAFRSSLLTDPDLL